MTDNPYTPWIEPELESYYQQGNPRAAFVSGLRQQLVNEAAKHAHHPAPTGLARRRIPSQPVLRYALAGALVLGLMVVALGPQRVLAAVEGLIGYIPGQGFVQDPSNARRLSQPVSATQGEVSIIAEAAVSDKANTRILLKAEGIRNLWKDFPSETGSYLPPAEPRLSYPGGSLVLDHYSQYEVGRTSVRMELVFAPLPEQTSDATLTFREIPGVRKENAPVDWSLQLHFKPGPGQGELKAAADQIVVSDTRHGITFTLDSIAQIDQQVALRLSMISSQPGTRVEYASWQRMLMRGGDGHPIPFINQRIYDPPYVTVMTFNSEVLDLTQPFTLTIPGPVELFQPIPAGDPQVEFSLDVGPSPQIGQSYPIDQTVRLDGQPVHIRSAHLEYGPTLVFDVDRQEGISGVTIEPVDAAPQVLLNQRGVTEIRGNGTVRHGDPSLRFQELPEGKLTFRVSAIDYLVEGPWVLRWQLPGPVQKP